MLEVVRDYGRMVSATTSSDAERRWLRVLSTLNEAQARLYVAQKALELGRSHTDRSAPGHLVHHISENCFSDRRARAAGSVRYAPGLWTVRAFLSATHRGSDRSLSRDDAAVSECELHLRQGEFFGWPNFVRPGFVQEGRARGRRRRSHHADL